MATNDPKMPTGLPIQEQMEMLQRVRQEITNLREHIKVLKPKAEAYDALRTVLGMMPGRLGEGMAEDVLFNIDKALRRVEKEYAPHIARSALGIEQEETTSG